MNGNVRLNELQMKFELTYLTAFWRLSGGGVSVLLSRSWATEHDGSFTGMVDAWERSKGLESPSVKSSASIKSSDKDSSGSQPICIFLSVDSAASFAFTYKNEISFLFEIFSQENETM